MLDRQRGAISLFWVGTGSALLAGVAMAALFSMRHERNLFAEGAAKVGAAAAKATAKATATAAPASGTLKRCVIDGRTVISNVDCKDGNRSTRTIAIHDTRGVEAPKAPPVARQEPTSNPAIDKMIEKQLR